jgi:hypothetical protein
MSEQPTTMAELLLATDQIRRMAQNKVIPTVAAYDFSSLPSETRRNFQIAFNAELARFTGLAAMPPDGSPVIVNAQTDHWYQTNDPGYHYSRLIDLTHNTGRRHR